MSTDMYRKDLDRRVREAVAEVTRLEESDRLGHSEALCQARRRVSYLGEMVARENERDSGSSEDVSHV